MQQTFGEQLFNALSWTFIHSLWQGLLLTILAGIVIYTTKRSSPSSRYALLVALLFCFIGTTLITFVSQWHVNGDAAATQLAAAKTVTGTGTSAWHNWWSDFTQLMNQYAGWIVPAWAVIVLLKLVRLAADFFYVHRLRTSYINHPDENWTIRLQQLSREIGIRKHVVLLESQLVNIPVVAGHFKPVILVPLGILARLSPAEVEAVLLHELAHIRRHDYLINLVQRITGIIFFFNPGVLWLSSLIRAERENCCDDIAITHTNNKLQFVEALISVKQHSLSSPGLAMNFLGPKSLLIHRVNRIVYNRNKSLSIAELLFFAVSLLCAVMLFSSTRQTTSSGNELFAAVRYVQSGTYLPGFINDKVKQQSATPVISRQERPSGISNHLTVAGKQEPASRSINQVPLKAKQPTEKKLTGRPAIAQTEPGPDATVSKYNQPEKGPTSAERYRIRAEKYRAQAELDRIQANKDREQAEKDRKQAERDRAQAEIDRKQAEKDREQAEKDRAQAEIDRKQADKDRAQAKHYRQAANTKPSSNIN